MKIGRWFHRLLLFVTMAFAQTLLANGGGYSFGIEATGQIQAFETKNLKNIVMAEEALDIELLPNEAVVKVRYILRNDGEERQVRFGFPVEGVGEYFGDKTASDATQPPTGFQQYSAKMEGEKLEAEWVIQPRTKNSDSPEAQGLAGWLVSEFSFPKESERVLEIRYRVAHSGTTTYVSDDYTESAKRFHYRFSSGAIWKGPIGKGSVSITFGEGVAGAFSEVEKPLNRFKKTKTGWVWSFENFEPTLADDLVVQVDPGFSSNVRFSPDDSKANQCFYTRKDMWGEGHYHYQVRASSELPAEKGFTYQATNLSQNEDSLENCWAEGAEGNGVGEWLQIEADKAERLIGLQIGGGYMKSDELFLANARPRKIRVELNGEETFVVILPNKKEHQIIWLDGYRKPVKTLKLTFEEIYPGSRFEDLCVSDLSLIRFLEREPQIQGAR